MPKSARKGVDKKPAEKKKEKLKDDPKSEPKSEKDKPKEETVDYRGKNDLALADWVKKVEKMGPRGILREFEALKKEMKPADRSEEVFAKHMLKNRYEDVGCWDQTRVKLVEAPEGKDYVHASWVSGVGTPNKYILCQGPLEEVEDESGKKAFEETIVDFWTMVWERKVQLLVMLCLLEENGKSKCSEYWPVKPKESWVWGDFAVTCKQTGEKAIDDQVICITQLTIQRKGDKKSVRELAHYLNKTWPDRSCPNNAGPIFDFLEKLEKVNETLGKKNGIEKKDSPILVHCSAGIGRSGTLVALDVAKTLMEKHKAIDVAHIVRTLRRSRKAAVQTHSQYSCIYVAVLHLVNVQNPALIPSSFNLSQFTVNLNNLMSRL